MSNIVSPLNNRFPLADGFRPANSGTLYIGKAGTDPTVVINQLTVTGRKSDGSTVSLTQPINLNNLGQPLDGNGNTIDLLVDSHYSFATFDAYGKLQTSVSTQIIIEVDGFASLRTLPVIYEGQRVKLLGWNKGTNIGGGEFVGHKGVGVDDGGAVAAGGSWYWERVTEVKVTPELYGIIIEDKTTNNFDKWNNFFNSGFELNVSAGDWYCNGGGIVLNNKSFCVVGEGRDLTNLIFTTVGHGIHLKVSNYDNGVPKFLLSDFSIKTTVSATDNAGYSGFFYDATEYIDTLPVISSGYKYLGERIESRGTARNCSFGTFTSESNEGWAQAVELKGVLGVVFDTCKFSLPRNFAGDGVWFHGDGMQSGVWFTNCVSMFGKIFFRMNDYLEGLYITGCNIINNHYGIWSYPDADTTVTAGVTLNTPVIHNSHILSYVKGIYLNWSVGGRFTHLEIYIQPTASISSNSGGIDIITCDSLILDGINCTFTTDIITQGYCIQLHAGRNNRVTNLSHRGGAVTYVVLLATTSTLKGTTVKDVTTSGAVNGIYANLANISSGFICDVPNINAAGSVTNPIQTSAEALSKISYNFKRHLIPATHAYASTGTLINLDLTNCNFSATPLFVHPNPRGAAYGGQIYHYRQDASSKTSATVQVSYVDGYASDTTSTRNVYFEVVGY